MAFDSSLRVAKALDTIATWCAVGACCLAVIAVTAMATALLWFVQIEAAKRQAEELNQRIERMFDR